MSTYTIFGSMGVYDDDGILCDVQRIEEHGTFEAAMHRCMELDNCYTNHPDLGYWVESSKPGDPTFYADEFYLVAPADWPAAVADMREMARTRRMERENAMSTFLGDIPF